MSEAGQHTCVRCARRPWLLEQLASPLDLCARDSARLFAALALEDEQLIHALGGRRAAQLHASWRSIQPAHAHESGPQAAEVPPVTICRHDERFPATLRHGLAPFSLQLAGAADAVAVLQRGPIVAVLGSTRASDYGSAVAAGLARGLAACGATVLSTLEDGIAAAVHAGAAQVHGVAVAVLAGGIGCAYPARLLSTLALVSRRGCALSEQLYTARSRFWSTLASRRSAAALAHATVLVEATTSASDLAGARTALELGRPLGAVPGRVSSNVSAGPHELLAGGCATLVRGAGDVLELLGQPPRPAAPGATRLSSLDPELRATLAAVGAGRDTAHKLTQRGEDPGEVLLRLSELELLGLLTRGHGGRYVPCDIASPR